MAHWLESQSNMTDSTITRRDLLRLLLLGASALCLGGEVLPAAGRGDAAGRPNIVVIVSDDQGYADSSCYDHPQEVSTPGIDRLAEEGVRFTNGYASAYVCAPTRAGLLTGRYQQRFGFYTAGDSRTGMPTNEITVADVLRKEGYATAIIGKWHVGLEPQ
ncbi:MAG: sulfatase-like hydrolase/transferase, partial [Planctomycetota bacterium]